jgi:hypothetical protein
MTLRLSFLALVALLAAATCSQAQDLPCDSCPGESPVGESHSRLKRCWHRLCDRLERKSCGYGKTHHDLGCSGCRADTIFVFGSCWQFFEEPCRRQPVPPHPFLGHFHGRD